MKKTTLLAPREVRKSCLKVYVNVDQRAKIEADADRCGLTVSTYLVALGMGYEPKSRLTETERDLLDNLSHARDDIERFASAMNGMSQSKRKQMFDSVQFMLKWFQALKPLSQALFKFITRIREANKFAGTTKIASQW
ncbi:MAG: hypothetical protein LIP02_03240 [Bacteroidales bacterium]|nr:hypothetical protein [Bacteroidales bacterium]